MSSFYGGGSSITVNMGAISELTGTESSSIVLSTLDYGNYVVNGFYLYTLSDTDLKLTGYNMLVSIMKDTETSNKVAVIETSENGVYCVYTITMYDDETWSIDKQTLGNKADTIFLNDSDLPETGTSGVLYVTELSIYQWSDETQTYIDLGAPVWSDIETTDSSTSSNFYEEPESQEVEDLGSVEEDLEDDEELVIP